MKMPFSIESLTRNKHENKPLPNDHWFSVIKNLYKKIGKEPSPLQIKTNLIVDTIKIPSGQISALETGANGNRLSLEKDKVIAELLTNKAGVMIDKKTDAVSLDPRDIYPKGLPSKLEKALDPRTAGIINLMYESKKSTSEKFGDTEDVLESERPLNYFRLPGGVDLLLIGYMHNEDWHRNHEEFLAKIGKFNPAVIGIEGLVWISPGASLAAFWENPIKQLDHYDKLMKQLVENGFTGLFTEVDMRDMSMISMDSQKANNERVFPNLPEEFFKKNYSFLEREEPQLSQKLIFPEGLKDALQKQSTTNTGLIGTLRKSHKKGTEHHALPYLKENMEPSAVPTGMELGQFFFTDALAAIKLHMTARLMTDGHLPKGPIVDFEGSNHLPSKAFFVRNPEYAVLVVLRTINELMAGKVKEKGNIEEIYDVFDNPNWTEIVKEITKLHFSKVDTTEGSSVEIGDGQHPIDKVSVDFLKIYNIDPSKVIPSDEEIKVMLQKLAKT